MFTIGELVFGWPQIVVLAIWVLALGYTAAHEGETKTSKYSFSHSLVAVGIVFFILWWGGFYT